MFNLHYIHSIYIADPEIQEGKENGLIFVTKGSQHSLCLLVPPIVRTSGH